MSFKVVNSKIEGIHMNINVEKSNLNEITETIESIFNKARGNSPNQIKQGKTSLKIQNKGKDSKKLADRRSLRAMKQNLRYSTNSRNTYQRLNKYNHNNKSSTNSSLTSHKKAILKSRNRKYLPTSSKSKNVRKYGDKSDNSISSYNKFGQYLNSKKRDNIGSNRVKNAIGSKKHIKGNKLSQKHGRSKKTLPNGKHSSIKSKYRKSSSQLSVNKTFSKVLKDFGRYKKQTFTRSNSKVNSTKFSSTNNSTTSYTNTDQFEGYFKNRDKGKNVTRTTKNSKRPNLMNKFSSKLRDKNVFSRVLTRSCDLVFISFFRLITSITVRGNPP